MLFACGGRFVICGGRFVIQISYVFYSKISINKKITTCQNVFFNISILSETLGGIMTSPNESDNFSDSLGRVKVGPSTLKMEL